MLQYLRVDNIRKQYRATTAVEDLSFSVEAGQIFALLGPNGAGKTTTVRMLLGLILPDSGKIRFPGASDDLLPSSRDVGYLPEERGLYLDQTVINTLTYLARLRGLSRSAARDCASHWLERFELGERSKDKIESLSKGNQQKVQLIASIQHRPAIIFLDEPFSGLDPLNQEKVLDVLRELKAEGTTIVLSAHQMALVERVADSLLLLSQGRAVLQGSLVDVLGAHKRSTRLSIQTDGPVAIDELSALPGVLETSQENDELDVLLDARLDLNDVLAWLASSCRMRSISTQTTTLHDVYVQTLAETQGGLPASAFDGQHNG